MSTNNYGYQSLTIGHYQFRYGMSTLISLSTYDLANQNTNDIVADTILAQNNATPTILGKSKKYYL